MDKYYIYLHANENGIFYIGKGCGKRAYSKAYRSLHWNNTINKYPNWEVIKLIDNLSEQQAYSIEEILINLIGLNNLTNVCEGGGDCTDKPYDRAGSKNPMYGKIHPNKDKSMPQNGHKKRVGMKHTKESILQNKLSQPSKKKVIWEGVEYCSIAECQRSTGICKGTIKRLNGIIDLSYTNKRKTSRKVAEEKLKYNKL